MKITEKYPGIDNLKTKLISRSIDKTRRESLGLGFMHKTVQAPFKLCSTTETAVTQSKTSKHNCINNRNIKSENYAQNAQKDIPNKNALVHNSLKLHKGTMIVDELNFRLKKYALIYVIRGKGEYVDLHGNKYPLSAGSVFQRHPEVMHSTLIDSESGWAECFIDFGTNLYNTLVAYNLIRDDHFVYQISPDKTIESECYELMVRLENCSEAELPFLASDMISFLAGIIQRCTTVSEGEMDRVIDKSCIFFSNNPAKRIELKKYCKTHGIGYESFRKAFRQKIGISPGQYIVKRRMDTACQMLRISRKPINRIASELGYSSQYEFSAQFKKIIGISPKAYRG